MNANEYPADYLAPSLQEDLFEPAACEEKGDTEPRILCGMLTPVPTGFFISFVIACEGCFVLSNLLGPQSGAPSIIPGLDMRNPFHELQQGLLEAVGIADLFACVATMVGLWLTRKAMPRLLRRCMEVKQAQLSTSCLGLILGYRALLTVLVPFWFGFMIAYDPDQRQGLIVLVMAFYLAFNVYFVWVVLSVWMYALDESQELESRLQQQDADEKMKLLGQAYAAGYPPASSPSPLIMEASPVMFGFLPLERTVTVYIAVLCVACVWWFVHILLYDGSSGGWAFFTRLPPVNLTFWLEIFVYLLTAIFSLIMLATLAFRRDDGEGIEEPLRVRKRITVMTMLYFIVSLMRFAFFIPITGMAIAMQDLCGLYQHGLWDVSVGRHVNQPVHCTLADGTTLLAVLLTFLLDGYLVWGVLRLWQNLRAKYVIDTGLDLAIDKANQPPYGSGPCISGWGASARFSYGSSEPKPMFKTA